ncbi:unnamed protein product [Closterium sp. NIES-53]
MIDAVIACSRTTVEMKRWADSSAVIDFLQAAKCAIFVSRSTTTRIASFPLAPAGNPMTKSIRTEPGGAGSGGAEPERAGPGGVGSGGVEPVGAGPGGPSGALSLRELPSPRELREWFARRLSRAAGAGGAASAGGSAAARGSGAGGAAGAGTGGSASAGGAGATGPGGARTGGIGATGPGGAPGVGATGGARAGGAAGVGATGGTEAGAAVSTGGFAGAGAAGGTGAGGAAGVGADVGGTGVVPAGSGGTARPRPYFIPLLEQVLGLPPSPSPAPSLACPPPVQSESQLQLVSPLPAPSPYAGPTGGLAERRGPESRPASPVRTARTSRRVPRQRPPAVPSTHQMALRPSTASQRVPLPSPPASSLLALADPESDSLRAASPTVTRVLATVVTDPSFESTAASAFVAELSASVPACPPSVGGECALSTDVLEDRQEEFQCFAATLPHLVSTLLAPEGDPDAPDIPTPHSYAKAIEGPYSSQWQAAMDAEMASWKSTGTYVDDIPPPGANIVSGMWIFRVKRPPGSPPVFKARYVARGFSQRQGVDYFQTFSLTPKMTTLRVLLHLAAQRDYELHSLDFNTAFLQGSLHEEIWLRRPPGFTGSFPAGTQWSLWRPVYGLRQAPREWHDTLRTTLASLGFAPSTADPSLFLRTDTLLPPFYILVYVVDDNFFQCPSLHSPLARSLNRNYHFQPQGCDAEGALANVTQIETLINKRFEVLLVADEAGFEAADRFQLYQSKSVLTSRSYKLAVADVAASKRAHMSYNRTVRGNGLDNGEIGNKGAGQGSCQNRAVKGTCFRCGQPGHMANACPMGGRGGQGPTPVV